MKFVAEMTSASFNISIRNDNLLELDETFELVINTSSLPIDVTVGMPTRATITIVDDDSKYIMHIRMYIKYVFNNQLRYCLNETSHSQSQHSCVRVNIYASDEAKSFESKEFIQELT